MTPIEQHIPYKLFPSCIPVRGASRSCIYDLERNLLHLIPNSLFELLEESQGKTLEQVKMDNGSKYDDIIDEYFEFMVEHELVFFTAQTGLFPVMNNQWHHSSPVTYAIIDLSENNIPMLRKIIEDLNTLDCQYMQVRAYDTHSINDYQQLVDATNFSTISSIEFILPFDTEISRKVWDEFCDKNKCVTRLIIHGSPQTDELFSSEYAVLISYITVRIENQKCCGIISSDYFTANIPTYTESLAHNTCLNRKISIDADGNIKNCPSMKESFGNIKDTTLKEAMNEPGFKKYWNITKDQITKCKDCEFRHICTDCRAYTENPDDMYSAPLKCGYDPYTCEWEEWSTNPLKQQAIQHYAMKELIK